jgi:hypothetical protein
MNMNLEQQLRQALERKNPAAGFDDRVMSRVATRHRVQAGSGAKRNSVVFLPVAASLMLAIGTAYYLQQQRRADVAPAYTEQAVHDVVLALQIASEKVAAAQAKVEEITRYEPEKNN